jgi:ubiquinone/menaquinone biosynthesis C-methylase UbiE
VAYAIGVDTADEVTIATVFGRGASTYDTVIPFFATFGQLLVNAVALAPGEQVLDLACGRGASLFPAVDAVGPTGRVVGVDLAAEMVAATVVALASTGCTNGEVRVMDAEHLDFPDGSFDAVLCGFAVFFFPNPVAVIAEVRRVLDAQSGRFAASTFTDAVGGYPWASDVAREVGKAAEPLPGPVRTAAQLAELLSEAGFEATISAAQARFVFRDVDHYIRWLWSHGSRRLLVQLDADELDHYRQASAGRLADHAVGGSYELVQGVEITVARPKGPLTVR